MLHNGVCLPDGWKEWLGGCVSCKSLLLREQQYVNLEIMMRGKLWTWLAGHTDHYNYALQFAFISIRDALS